MIKICPETNEECEYEPADDEPCHQCRIYRINNHPIDEEVKKMYNEAHKTDFFIICLLTLTILGLMWLTLIRMG